MSRTTLQTIGFFVALACIVAGAPLLWQIGSSDDKTAGLEIGQPLPHFTGIGGWLNGDGLTDEDLRGKVVFVNSWFLTCPYCHKGMPDLVEIYEKYQDKGVVFVGMTFDDEESRDNIQRFLEKYKVEWPNAYGARESLESFKAEYFPGYWLIGRDGTVVWNKSLQGKVAIESAIDEALAVSAPTS
ncbi:MAG: TlpA disulfide reductase family protein [Planctomycetota bacterium]|nr:TlpA disulfide reductase family protein [Planctomycetota bacterium]MDA1164626.1 TlpA disulfide reductase family protein [Planctomycetota bacterium]